MSIQSDIHTNVRYPLIDEFGAERSCLMEVDGIRVPAAPSSIEETGLQAWVLADLILKMAYTIPSLTTHAASEQLCLPRHLVEELLLELKTNRMVEVLGESGTAGYRYAISSKGRERAAQLFEVSGYVGPAPVSLDTYTAVLQAQFDDLPEVESQRVDGALADLVLTRRATEVAGLACASRRPLFLYGPPGNGKTTIGHRIHDAVEGHLWIPYCIGIESSAIRVFDSQVHEYDPPEQTPEQATRIDRRWVRVRRPFIVVGGELTIDALDLTYSPSLKYYEAPLHFKANGGTFLLDDFGFQRVEPNELLARWVFPLETGIDHLTLQTGQKLQVPFRQMLIISTNMDPTKVMDPAFLRRLGYRLYVGDPDPEGYRRIFERLAARMGLSLPPGLLDRVLERYRTEGRALRGCEPRDLIHRVHDICNYRKTAFTLDDEILELAWTGYFGERIGRSQ